MRGHRVVVGATGVVAVLALTLLGRMASIHRETWDWRLTPAAAPTKVQLGGREYLRGGPEWNRPAGLHEVGRTDGGGVVLTTAGGAGTPTVVYVQVGSQLTGYALMGGP
jgi:hypothetical protein